MASSRLLALLAAALAEAARLPPPPPAEPDHAAAPMRWSHLSLRSSSGHAVLSSLLPIEARAGKLLGVLGPSGSGKTTLLNVLAGACPRHRGAVLTGEASAAVPPAAAVGMLAQHEAFFAMLTVREVLLAAATLQPIGAESDAERIARVDAVLKTLGLAHVQHARVGDTLRRGISGGERRRLAVACELLGEPRLLLADEATSGLDAKQAESVVLLLRRLAVERRVPVVATMHQPRSSIWRALDDLLLLGAGGQLVYHGAAGEAALRYFAALGHSCPPHTNPAEFLIDLVSIEHDAPDGGEADRARSVRDGQLNALRLGVSGLLALLLGEMFGRFGGAASAASVAERIACHSYGAIVMAMMATVKSLDAIGRERHVVRRERRRGQYSALEYVAAKLATELPLDAAVAAAFGALLHSRVSPRVPLRPFVCALGLNALTCAGLGLAIGALAPSAEAALASGIPVMVVHMVLGVINPAGVDPTRPPPRVLRLLSHASPIKWSVRQLCCLELRGMKLSRSARNAPRMGGLALVKSGDEVLERLGLAHESAAHCVRAQLSLLAVELALALCGLQLTQPRTQPMLPVAP
ncbi:hypothetical protein AB1Y20_010385 [Prymnesium parvum]|uniref:ABC transporter domain-containing protein n=1 Tax=Prymnesium parvum TaxID=97485 RepID=A0AB34IR74_PRYPA